MRYIENSRPRITCRVWNMREILIKKQRLSAVKKGRKADAHWTEVKKR